MNRDRKAIARGLLAGAILSLAIAGMVSAYAGQVAATVQVSAPSGDQACGTPITVTATVEDTNGNLISGQTVTWSFQSGNISGDKILSTTSTTNNSGVATTQVEFACSAHSVRILAVAGEASGTVVVATSGKGLPRTDTAGVGTSSLTILLAAIAVLFGAGMILRRFATSRR